MYFKHCMPSQRIREGQAAGRTMASNGGEHLGRAGWRTWEQVEAAVLWCGIDVLAAQSAAGQRRVGQQSHVAIGGRAGLTARTAQVHSASQLAPRADSGVDAGGGEQARCCMGQCAPQPGPSQRGRAPTGSTRSAERRRVGGLASEWKGGTGGAAGCRQQGSGGGRLHLDGHDLRQPRRLRELGEAHDAERSLIGHANVAHLGSAE